MRMAQNSKTNDPGPMTHIVYTPGGGGAAVGRLLDDSAAERGSPSPPYRVDAVTAIPPKAAGHADGVKKVHEDHEKGDCNVFMGFSARVSLHFSWGAWAGVSLLRGSLFDNWAVGSEAQLAASAPA